MYHKKREEKKRKEKKRKEKEIKYAVDINLERKLPKYRIFKLT